ncbi:hypothetical protein F4808DRAFT_216794 [Astrocystis sublimbata]|nr:hypothetical protein F4808DRAFT_216794 [Astrocystis sublimbata]
MQNSIDDSMNESPSYAHFNFQHEEDLNFGMFDVPANHPGFHTGMQPETYPDAFSLHPPGPSSGHVSAHNSPFAFIPRSFVAAYDEPSRSSPPYITHTKLESPELSTEPFSTPETRDSQVTHKNQSSTKHILGNEDDYLDNEDEGDYDDFDNDPLPLMSSASTRTKLGAKQPNRATTSRENAISAGQFTNPNVRGKDGKRRHFLQRNRVAAMKCRKKKKEWVNDLEETKTGLESQNTHLHMELDGLVDEASRIRAQLMAHANCNDSNIDKWIENEAKRFVIGTGERYDQILAHTQFNSPGQSQTGGNVHDGRMSSVPSIPSMSSMPSMPSGSSVESEYPLTTPTPHPHPHHPAAQVPTSPAFYTPTGHPGIHTPGCYGVPPHEAAQFAQGLGHAPRCDGEPDYDGMPLALYEHQVS